jgi:methyl-accepting chemotaxis protein WspA
MKKMTLWQRLNIALVLMILLLVGGFCVVYWTKNADSDSKLRIAELSSAKSKVRLDLVEADDAIRGFLLEPKNEFEKARWRQASTDLKASILNAQHVGVHHTNLFEASIALQDFAQKKLGPFQSRVLEIAETNATQAAVFYSEGQPEIRDQREHLFSEISQQAEKFSDSEKARAESIDYLGIGMVVVLIFSSILLAFLHSSAVKKPLNLLVDSLERMRRGDFTERLALNGSDEFGVLSDGLNRLADDLSDLVGQVQRSGIQVNTTATEIAATAKQQQTTAHEIAATTSEIGATSKEISATSKELVKTMNEVNHVAEETAKLASSGQTSIGRMEMTMRQIMEASGSITAKLAVLSEKTTNINSVVTTITKVADQTNLLSLNAAIEAEKAGEYGLGFAVVAMEIRRLADQTAVATYDIEKMVKEMQSAVAAGVMGMDKFSEEVRRGVEEIRQVSTHLAQIIHQVQTLTPRFQTVNEGMHAQATGAQQISETLTQLSEAAQQTAESLRQSNAAIEQLNGAARGLQTSVARFKLSN